MEPLKDTRPTRQSLLNRLKDVADDESWREFFETYWRLIYRTGREAGLSESETEDLVQETVVSVFRKMPGFEYDPKKGSFRNWLLTLTRWRIADQWRRRKRSKETSLSKPEREEEASHIEGDSALDRFWNAEWEKNLLEAAIERAKKKVNPKEFQIFDLCVLREVPLAVVTNRLNIRAAQVYKANFRVRAAVKKELIYLKKRDE